MVPSTLAALLVVVLGCCVAVTFDPGIGYQLHSFNDLRQWPQLLHRGAQFLKIDVRWIPDTECLRLRIPILHGSNFGCMPLVHNPIKNDTHPHHFDTLDSLLDFLVDPNYSRYFQQSERKYISICHKYPLTCNTTNENLAVIRVFDQFYYRARQMIITNDLNLEFVLDGSLTSTRRDCFMHRWSPWISSWIPGRDNWSAALSNDNETGSESFQMLNMKVGTLRKMQSIHYGKFANTTYPFLTWEPSDQKRILDISKEYLKRPPHPAGFKFSINIDPARFEVYSAARSGIGWNHVITSIAVQHPYVTLIPHPNCTYILSIFFVSGSCRYVFNTTSGILKEVSSTHSQGPPSLLPFEPTSQQLSLAVLHGSEVQAPPHLLVVDSLGFFSILSVEHSHEQPFLKSVSTVGKLLPDEPFLSNIRVCTIQMRKKTYIAGLHSKMSCSVQFQLWSLDAESSVTPIGKGTCITHSPITQATLAGLYIQGNTEDSRCPSGTLSIVMAMSNSTGQILFGHACVNVASGGIVGSILPTAVTVGYKPKILHSLLNSKPFVFMVYEHSFCWNTETTNKISEGNVCDLDPLSSKTGPLGFSYGYLSEWIRHAEEQIQFSVCSETIFHGSYDFGTNPDVALFNSQHQFGFAEVHQGPQQQQTPCGSAIPRPDQVILDSFTVYPPRIVSETKTVTPANAFLFFSITFLIVSLLRKFHNPNWKQYKHQ
ncbi:hypothetical protein Pelo_2018 [Pelomyxa schiedti]|nr:hypothetical protein Pelo_2018 [Pelomyxa schiedti]